METMLIKMFQDCKEGKIGVMPYSGERIIRFVWNDGWMGRIADITLTKEGKLKAEELYRELEEFQIPTEN